MAPKASTTRQVIQIDGLAFGSSPIIEARGARTVMTQYFRPLNTEKEHTLIVRGEEITIPQVGRASNCHVPKVHVH